MSRKLFHLLVLCIFLIGFFKPVEAAHPQPEALTLGPSGTSFRYVKTIGVTEAPYLDDNTHLNYPYGLAVDQNNDVYILELLGKRVLKFDDTGAFLYKMGIAGVNILGDYSFDDPHDAAIDQNNDLWIADWNRVAKYSPSGVFLMQFPAVDPWQSGSANDRFNYVAGIAFDALGRLYVSDSNNQRVQIFDLDINGNPVWVKTLGVTGETGSDNLHFNSPQRLAVANGQLFIADSQNHRIQVYTVSGADPASISYLDTIGVSGVPGQDNQHFDNPFGVAANAAYIFVSELNTNRVQVFNAVDRQYVTTAVTGGTNPGSIWVPSDIALDAAGNLYIADSYNHRVQFFTKGSGATWAYTRITGTSNVPYLTDANHFNKPRVAVDVYDNLVVLEENGQRLSKFDVNGNLVFQIGTPGIERDPNRGTEDDFHFSWPHDVATGSGGTIYVADNNRVQIYTAAGAFVNTIGGSWGNGDYQFQWAAGIAVDRNNGNIYVSDCPNHRVQVYNSSRIHIATLGVNGVSGTDNSHFNCPVGVEVDSGGNIFVADGGNNRVQKFNSSRVYQMTFGTPGSDSDSYADVSAEDVTVDGLGRVYVAGWNNRVQVFDSTGAYLTTIGGSYGSKSSQFRGAAGVAVDSKNNVYVADFTNARIQVFALGVPGWKQSNINGFGNIHHRGTSLEVFNGQLYSGTVNWDDGAQMFRSPDGKTWSAVSELGFGAGVATPAVQDMIVFNNQLYVGTGWNQAGIWRTSNGTDWEEVASAGLGNADNVAVDVFEILNGKLYASMQNGATGIEIWCSDTGNAGSWSAVVTNGNGSGSENGPWISDSIVFDGAIYVTVRNDAEGVVVLKSANGTVWTQANISGFGSIQNGSSGLAVHNGFLYAGTANSATGGQLWRTSNGADWEQVIGNGFGDPSNPTIDGLFTFGKSIYAIAAFGPRGLQVWKSDNGTSWRQVSPDGFGNGNYNATFGTRGLTVFNGSLYIGTVDWNGEARGAQIWQMLHQVNLPAILR